MNKIKFFKASFYYQGFIDYKYQKDPQLLSSDYATNLESFFKERFGWSNYWKKHLERLGDYSVEEVITNNEVLQKKWASERNFKYSEMNWLHDILTEQIIAFQPDVLFAHDYYSMDANYLSFIKEKCPSIKLVLAWDGINYCDPEKYKNVDIVLACLPQTPKFYNERTNIKSMYFQFCLDDDLATEIQYQKDPEIDITFIGSVFTFQNGHNFRFEILNEVARKFKVNYWIPNLNMSKVFTKTSAKQILGGQFGNFIKKARLSALSKGSIFGMDMYNELANSKISLNSHIDAAEDFAGNFRIPEITGAKSCLLTDHKKNMPELFRLGEEAETYDSIDSAIEKIEFLLNNPEKRKTIAQNGFERTVRDYSYSKRMKELSQYIKGFL